MDAMISGTDIKVQLLIFQCRISIEVVNKSFACKGLFSEMLSRQAQTFILDPEQQRYSRESAPAKANFFFLLM